MRCRNVGRQPLFKRETVKCKRSPWPEGHFFHGSSLSSLWVQRVVLEDSSAKRGPVSEERDFEVAATAGLSMHARRGVNLKFFGKSEPVLRSAANPEAFSLTPVFCWAAETRVLLTHSSCIQSLLPLCVSRESFTQHS